MESDLKGPACNASKLSVERARCVDSPAAAPAGNSSAIQLKQVSQCEGVCSTPMCIAKQAAVVCAAGQSVWLCVDCQLPVNSAVTALVVRDVSSRLSGYKHS